MIYTLRGKKTSIARKKIDVILTAVKMAPEGKLVFARGYVRRDPVWGDRVVLERDDLIQRVRDGVKIYTGVEVETVGDFEVWKRVELAGNEGLIVEGDQEEGERLGLPLL